MLRVWWLAVIFAALAAALAQVAESTSFPDWRKRSSDAAYARATFACKYESDCMNLGHCSEDGTRCICDEGFKGSRCHELDLLPSSINMGFNSVNFPSWGGVVLRSPASSSSSPSSPSQTEYHMFASYMVNKCDLFSYGTNSAVLRAVAHKPEGPYTYQAQVLEPFHHGTVAVEDDEHVYLFADGDRTLPSKYIHDCRRKRDSRDMTPHTIVSPKVTTGDYAYGRAPHDFISVTTLRKPDMTVVEANRVVLQTNLDAGLACNKTNPSPVLLPKGGTAMVLRGTYCDRTGAEPRCPPHSSCQHQHLFFATTKEDGGSSISAFEFEPESKWTHIKQLSGSEDPFLWIDSKQRYHLLVHSKLACGGVRGPREDRCVLMATSKDGKRWSSAWRPAFEGKVEFQDSNVKHELHLFQRPKILFDEDGTTPLFLIGGARRTPRSATQTLMIPFNVASNREKFTKPKKTKSPKQQQQQERRPTTTMAAKADVDADTMTTPDEEEEEEVEVEEENEEEAVDDDDVYADPTATTPPPSKGYIAAIVFLGVAVAPVGFAVSYVCVRCAIRVQGYRAVSQHDRGD